MTRLGYGLFARGARARALVAALACALSGCAGGIPEGARSPLELLAEEEGSLIECDALAPRRGRCRGAILVS